jgi:hypothetical protein
MVVQTQHRHPGHSGAVGLYIGKVNVQRYFPRDVADVELELDHLCIVCPLEPAFWQDRPEIHDFRLSCWLESKRNSGKLAANPAPVAMIPSGDRTFRLQLEIKDDSEPSFVGIMGLSAMGAAYLSQTLSQSANKQPKPDRRKHDSGRTPDRRRVARLKSDDSSSSSASY